MGRWLVFLCAMAGCLQDSLVPCGNNLCPVGARCIEDVCVGANPCGNGEVQPGEACDDGNLTSGDGCRADCQKVEVCGDRVLDENEACDDGNTNASDGCDQCRTTTWAAEAIIAGESNPLETPIRGVTSITRDSAGALYYTSQHQIFRLDPDGFTTLVAGTGGQGFSGDFGPATQATFANPTSITVDGVGNVYVSDTDNARIRRIDSAGIVTTVVGTTRGFSGDGGPATAAQIEFVRGIAVDGAGRIFLADLGNSRIRMVDTRGIISTFAGTGEFGASGDGGPPSAAKLGALGPMAIDEDETLYFADGASFRTVRRIRDNVIESVAGGPPGSGGVDGSPATDVFFEYVEGISSDGAGGFLFADPSIGKVYRVDADGIIDTFAGTGTRGFSGDGGPADRAQLEGPTGMTLDGSGGVFIVDGARIRHVTATGVISTAAGTGSAVATGPGRLATATELNPGGIAVAGPDEIFVADLAACVIRRVDVDGFISTVAGTGVCNVGHVTPEADVDARAVSLGNVPVLVPEPSGGLLFIDEGTRTVRRLTPAGRVVNVVGSGEFGAGGNEGPAVDAQLGSPQALAVAPDGTIYVGDSSFHVVRRVSPDGIIHAFAGSGNQGNDGDGGPPTAADLDSINALALGPDGSVYIADARSRRVRRVNGTITTIAGSETFRPFVDGALALETTLPLLAAIAIDPAGRLLVGDLSLGRVLRLDPDGTLHSIAGDGLPLIAPPLGPPLWGRGDGGPASAATVHGPSALAVAATGAIYLVEPSVRVRRIEPGGRITTVAGGADPLGMGGIARGRLSDARALTRDGDLLLVAGGDTGRIQAVRLDEGRLSVVAGRYPHSQGTSSFARFRDGFFGTTEGVAVDHDARVMYLTETSNSAIHVVEMLDPANEETWTITPLVGSKDGFIDGDASAARFRQPSGLLLDAAARRLYVADRGNHVIRAIALSTPTTASSVSTVAGTPRQRGTDGDGGPAVAARLYDPRALARCANGDLFIADTGNHRVRRIDAAGVITTVLGDGTVASAGEGAPASSFPVQSPLGIACDAAGNVAVTGTSVVRLLPANDQGIVDGLGHVASIYGKAPRDRFPQSATRCLSGLAAAGDGRWDVTDSCTGLLVEITRRTD